MKRHAFAASKACWLVPMVGLWPPKWKAQFLENSTAPRLPSPQSPSFCQRLVASQLERLTKPIVGLEGGCSWPIWKNPGAASGMWEPSGNHLGKAEKKLVPHSAPTLQLYAASLYWWKKRHAMWNRNLPGSVAPPVWPRVPERSTWQERDSTMVQSQHHGDLMGYGSKSQYMGMDQYL